MYKPILFSTPMVQAIKREVDPKTMTRRVIVPQPQGSKCLGVCTSSTDKKHTGMVGFGDDCLVRSYAKPRYSKGDILWVRETCWKGYDGEYHFKADYVYGTKQLCKDIKVIPSIFMPKAAARIFLRVTDVRAERLQEIKMNDMLAEGCIPEGVMGGQWQQWQRDYWIPLWNKLNAKPKPQYITVDGKKRIGHYVSYPWEDVQKTRTWRGKPWHVIGNPWVWAYTFEQTEKPKDWEA